jgi:cyclic beta-1,2-glucan synthetase
VQIDSDTRIAHRTSPTNIGMGLLATLAAHDFGFIDTDTLIVRLDATLTTVEGLERFEGHLLNWYDTSTLAPLTPAYLSTVDSGNLAGALMTLASGLRLLMDHAEPAQARRLEELSARATVFVDGINFRFLYDRQRRLFSIGYRLADGEGPGRFDPAFYDLLASEARLASFVAIAKGEVPEMHWFHLGRLITSIHGAPVLLSWSATLFGTDAATRDAQLSEHALDESCRMVIRRQMEHAVCLVERRGASPSRRTGRSIGTANHQYRRSASQVSVEARAGRRGRRRAVCNGASRCDRSGAQRRQPPASCGRGGARRLWFFRRD